MIQARSNWHRLKLLALTGLWWLAVYGVAFAQAKTKDEYTSGAGADQPYVISYAVLLLCVALGLLVVFHGSRRRDRPKGEAYVTASGRKVVAAPTVPVVRIGMTEEAIDKVLGRPKQRRVMPGLVTRLAPVLQKLGIAYEQGTDAEYTIYEHPAGSYQLIYYGNHVVQVHSQPQPPQPKPE
jgi:hypothetical protein